MSDHRCVMCDTPMEPEACKDCTTGAFEAVGFPKDGEVPQTAYAFDLWASGQGLDNRDAAYHVAKAVWNAALRVRGAARSIGRTTVSCVAPGRWPLFWSKRDAIQFSGRSGSEPRCFTSRSGAWASIGVWTVCPSASGSAVGETAMNDCVSFMSNRNRLVGIVRATYVHREDFNRYAADVAVGASLWFVMADDLTGTDQGLGGDPL